MYYFILSLFNIFNRIKLFQKISKIYMLHTLKYNKNLLILIFEINFKIINYYYF